MGTEAWTTLGVLALVMALLVFTRVAPYLVLSAGLAILLTLGVVTEQEFLGGLANPGMVTVGVLFLVEKPDREGMIGVLIIIGVLLAGIDNAFKLWKSKPDDTL